MDWREKMRLPFKKGVRCEIIGLRSFYHCKLGDIVTIKDDTQQKILSNEYGLPAGSPWRNTREHDNGIFECDMKVLR